MASTINPLRTAYHILFESTQRPREFIDNSPQVRGPPAEIPNPILAGPNGLIPIGNPPIEVGGFAPHLNEWVPTGKHPLKDPP